MGIAPLALFVFAFAPLLDHPWPCGETHTVSQAHGGFSHQGANFWAWDFDLKVGDEVWAASAGVVAKLEMHNELGGCDPSYGPHANYVLIDHGDGTGALYMHLQAHSSPLMVGDEVQPGDLIARVGLTGFVCGPHLHFQVQNMCNADSFCPAIPAEFVDYGDPPVGTPIVSTNCPACTADLDGRQTVVDERDGACFLRTGKPWSSAFVGEDGHHFFVSTRKADAPKFVGEWSFSVSVAGRYVVEVFVPEEHADAEGAVYEIHHLDGVSRVTVNQAADKGWRNLGSYAFASAGEGRVVLADNTGEGSPSGARQLAYDAVRLTSEFSGLPGYDFDTTGGAPGGHEGGAGPADGRGTTGDDGASAGLDPGRRRRGAFAYGCRANDAAPPKLSLALILVVLLTSVGRDRSRTSTHRT